MTYRSIITLIFIISSITVEKSVSIHYVCFYFDLAVSQKTQEGDRKVYLLQNQNRKNFGVA